MRRISFQAEDQPSSACAQQRGAIERRLQAVPCRPHAVRVRMHAPEQRRPAENNAFCFNLPLCLSRACLGKYSFLELNGSKNRVFRTAESRGRHRTCPGAAAYCPRAAAPRTRGSPSLSAAGTCAQRLRKTPFYPQLKFLCLSRACLGKWVFRLKWLQKGVFHTIKGDRFDHWKDVLTVALELR